MGFVLFVISFVLVVTFAPLGLIYTLIKSIVKNDSKYLSKHYRDMALSLDQFGNVAMKSLFNWLLITEEGSQFGNPDETISSVLGKNELKGTFKIWGYCLNRLLNKIDKNHSINSIEE